MAVKEFFLEGKREKKNVEDIKKSVTKSKNFRNDNLNNAKVLLLFENSNQKSWLVKTDKRVYKILDDRRKKKPNINWSVALETFKKNNTKIKEELYKKELGKIVVEVNGKAKENLYRKDYFQLNNIKNAVKELIED